LGVSSLIANQAAKRLSFRSRPDRKLVPVQRRTPHKGSSSFPSGHTASAVAFAIVASDAHKALTAPLTGLAAAFALSRVFTGMHYPSDVIAGAALGAGVAMTARHFIPRGKNVTSRHGHSAPNYRAAAGRKVTVGQLRRQHRADLQNARRDLLERW